MRHPVAYALPFLTPVLSCPAPSFPGQQAREGRPRAHRQPVRPRTRTAHKTIQGVVCVRFRTLLLVTVAAMGLAAVGCNKPTEQGAVPASPAPNTPPAQDQAQTLVLTDPNGEELALTTAGADETIATDLGIPLYPGAKPYTIDLAAMGLADQTGLGEATPEIVDLTIQAAAKSSVVFVTEDPFDDVLDWAKGNLDGWTVGEPEEHEGVKSAAITSPDHADVDAVLGDLGDYRAVVVTDGARAADLNARIQELTMQALAEVAEAKATESAPFTPSQDGPKQGTP